MRTARSEIARVLVASIVGGAILSSVAFFAFYAYSRANGGSPFTSQPTQLITADFPNTALPQKNPQTLLTQGFTTHSAGSVQVTRLFDLALAYPSNHKVVDFQSSAGAYVCVLLLDGAQISTTHDQQLYDGSAYYHMQGMTATSPLNAGRHSVSLQCTVFALDQTAEIIVQSRGTSLIIVQ